MNSSKFFLLNIFFFFFLSLSFSQIKIDLEKKTKFSIKDSLKIYVDLTELSDSFTDQEIFGNDENDFEIILIHSRLGTSPFLLVGDEQKVDALLDQTLIKSLPHYRVGCCNDTSLFHEFHH